MNFQFLKIWVSENEYNLTANFKYATHKYTLVENFEISLNLSFILLVWNIRWAFFLLCYVAIFRKKIN